MWPWALRDGQSREETRAGAVDDALLHRVMRSSAGPEGMSEDTISVRMGSDKKAALDAIAAPTHRDLSLVIDEALNAYLELHALATRAHCGGHAAGRCRRVRIKHPRPPRARPMAALTIRWTRQAVAKACHDGSCRTKQ
jgi:predicted transcriptional regulator